MTVQSQFSDTNQLYAFNVPSYLSNFYVTFLKFFP